MYVWCCTWYGFPLDPGTISSPWLSGVHCTPAEGWLGPAWSGEEDEDDGFELPRRTAGWMGVLGVGMRSTGSPTGLTGAGDAGGDGEGEAEAELQHAYATYRGEKSMV